MSKDLCFVSNTISPGCEVHVSVMLFYISFEFFYTGANNYRHLHRCITNSSLTQHCRKEGKSHKNQASHTSGAENECININQQGHNFEIGLNPAVKSC